MATTYPGGNKRDEQYLSSKQQDAKALSPPVQGYNPQAAAGLPGPVAGLILRAPGRSETPGERPDPGCGRQSYG
ncbi:hypothetical protein llap_11680 [Limosa lapponica baueri]|uniref:Uncharacterized protein n=1 Tax=Limosa lapponica baueri TaxID=1758121 RepID=A0A2I0TW42_LIMLA|nr:hypothetical protein llap_11680 [Limosa lapponica baueri]